MAALNASYENHVKCPVCGQEGKIRSMDCHHLIPKSVAPQLKFVAENLQFVHKECHKKIHEFMGDAKNKNTQMTDNGKQPHQMLKAELLEAYLELAGYFAAAEQDLFNKRATYYVSPQSCPQWVKRWKRRY